MKSTLAFASLCVIAAGCSSGDDNMPKVVLGAVIDQTGNNSELSWLQAVQLAVENMNDALESEGNYKNFRFALNAQNSENDVNGGPDSRAITRLRAAVNAGAKGAILDTTQIAEEANKPMYAWGVPLQCTSCTGGAFLNGTSSDPDPQLQASRRNDERWMSRTIMSTSALSVVIAQLIRGDTNQGDLNGDHTLKIVTIGADEPFGQGTTTAVINEVPKHYPEHAADLATFYHHERYLHPNLSDATQIPFADFIPKMTNDYNEETMVTDGRPDYIVVSTFGKNDVAFTEEFKGEGIEGIKLLHFHTFRISSNLLALGSLGEGEEGVSHILLDGPNGDVFAASFRKKFGLIPQYRDANYYDNAVTLMMAMLMAMGEVENANDISGERIRDFIPCTSIGSARKLTDRPTVVCPSGDSIAQIAPGVDGMRTAIEAIVAGQPIEYTGGSGPIDYDSRGNIKDKAAHYIIQNGQYVDIARFDCIADTTKCPCIDDGGSCPAP